MLKVKKHDIVNKKNYPIFRNTETFVHDLGDIRKKMLGIEVKYMGSMTKHRVKDFIIDLKDGYVYSLAVTICEVNEVQQHQLEVEYFGHIGEFSQSELSEEDILEHLVDVTDSIYSSTPENFIISTERKYEFVQMNRSPNENDQEIKEKIIDNLINI